MRTEKEINRMYADVKADLENAGITIGYVTKSHINGRLKRALGQCKKKGYEYDISLNRCMLLDKMPEQEVKNTIAHELLHTCRGGFNHTETWKRLADRLMTSKPQYRITRVTDVANLNCEAKDLGYRKANYVVMLHNVFPKKPWMLDYSEWYESVGIKQMETKSAAWQCQLKSDIVNIAKFVGNITKNAIKMSAFFADIAENSRYTLDGFKTYAECVHELTGCGKTQAYVYRDIGKTCTEKKNGRVCVKPEFNGYSMTALDCIYHASVNHDTASMVDFIKSHNITPETKCKQIKELAKSSDKAETETVKNNAVDRKALKSEFVKLANELKGALAGKELEKLERMNVIFNALIK